MKLCRPVYYSLSQTWAESQASWAEQRQGYPGGYSAGRHAQMHSMCMSVCEILLTLHDAASTDSLKRGGRVAIAWAVNTGHLRKAELPVSGPFHHETHPAVIWYICNAGPCRLGWQACRHSAAWAALCKAQRFKTSAMPACSPMQPPPPVKHHH